MDDIYSTVAVPPQSTGPALGIEVTKISKRFGSVQALTDVSFKVEAGSFHALLGENGAGKSTLVKCLVGFQSSDTGAVIVDGRETEIPNPKHASALGIGMVYQHFTVATGMTVAENLLLARGTIPAVINWRKEKEDLRTFLATTPFKLDVDAMVSSLAAGEKQKLEILKQLYLKRRFLILDEPTSVLTPGEADEILGMLRDMTKRGELTVLMISHKFREVTAFCDAFSVLRKGRHVGDGKVGVVSPAQMADMMVGSSLPSKEAASGAGHEKTARPLPPGPDAAVKLQIDKLTMRNDKGSVAVRTLSLSVRQGEIVGIAGVSGNGQKELVEALLGQRAIESGNITVKGEPYHASRSEMRRHKLYSLPEEPLRNACIAGMTVAENIALRNFDQAPLAIGWRLKQSSLLTQAQKLIADFNVKPARPDLPIGSLSGGNVQRAVLARELSASVDVLIVANPVFGLDFAAVAEIHGRLLAARDAGTAVLLVSEDLDELLELSDRLLVISEGQIVYETPTTSADIAIIGQAMAGNHGEHAHAA
jgi:general nucleoside transport system ATP-binding protein